MTTTTKPPRPNEPPQSEGFRRALHTIIFEADTRAGKIFSVTLLVCILLSVSAVMLESVEHVGRLYARELHVIEAVFTVLFTIEYILRLICVRRPLRYATSPFGIVDLIAILPTFIALVVPGTQSFMAIRLLRLLRVFRIFKLAEYVGETNTILRALRAGRRKITVFLLFIITVVTSIGAVMYVIEGPDHGFTSIPTGMYWAIVTLTTVGYGDIAPQTPFGQFLASIIMVLGYGVIAVPTGIVTSELTIAAAQAKKRITTQMCPSCSRPDHDVDARFCKHCGNPL